MSLVNKKIWIDLEQPKAAIMLNSLIKMFKSEEAEVMITARDYDSTYKLLEEKNIEFTKVGEHGGSKLETKLQTYIERLGGLFPLVKKFQPDYFVTFMSIEGIRIAYGLKIPSIGFNDEPRNIPVCKLMLPFIDHVITPQCIPKEWYIQLCAEARKITQYNGIDEIAWLSEFTPNPKKLKSFDLEKNKYVIMRSEPSSACYFLDRLKPNETLLSEIFPPLFRRFPNHKYLLLVRNQVQKDFLKKTLKKYQDKPNLIITQYLPHLDDLCFYSSLVISGGGTIVRESSLLNIPSIEFFPGETAPQEHFLINNGFPLEHIEGVDRITRRAINIIEEGSNAERDIQSVQNKIKKYDNPNKICFNYVKVNMG
ncbi:MAG: DUF354 domain-containing protein [Candidatus Lokiarchaeota archaeon]|nr:DUF354 domain-containing protein [Candidatus Lokiarchaeota archaeon]MBD3202608.1 DUF354 domain-containing protein [Candidatus Lokiarchaeota archaeon]